jgi:SpoVK/Ycf46/Vps4 family AAA+-type ATPase
VWRRFHYLLHIDLPSLEQREEFWKLFSDDLNWGTKDLKALADLSEGFSVAAIEGAATRVRQQAVTRQMKPTLHAALTALASLARGQSSMKTALSSIRLDEPRTLAKQLHKRNPGLYSLSVAGEIAGISKATMSRHAAKRQAKRKE